MSLIRFAIGELVHHRRFGYRGVVVGVDTEFRLTEEWYAVMARSEPPRDRPWYRVLVDGSERVTYVAERNLECDDSGEPVEHPLIRHYFSEFVDGFYRDTRVLN